MRPSVRDYYLLMAKVVAMRSTCYRRNVGCVLTDAGDRLLATGRNGVPSTKPHCNHRNQDGLMPFLCEGAMSASGTNLSSCSAVHAEVNALISCRNPEDIETAYVTASPCHLCIGPLLNSACQTIVFIEHYPHRGAEKMWTDAGRRWVQHTPDYSYMMGAIPEVAPVLNLGGTS